MAAKNPSSEYSAQQIQVLEGLEPVRKRPGMYIGSTDSTGLHESLREIIDNAVDEALAGFGKNVWVILNKDGSATVVDDGRGIPVDTMPGYGKSALEMVMTKLHAGGKFGGSAYKVSGGLHGVGSSVVNALSDWLWVEVLREGKLYRQEYKRGDPQTGVDVVKDSKLALEVKRNSGTTVTFFPDNTIFQTLEFDFEFIKKLSATEHTSSLKSISTSMTIGEKKQKRFIITLRAVLKHSLRRLMKIKTLFTK